MNTVLTIIVYGVPASLIISLILLAMVRSNPRLMLRSYPKDVKAAVPPQTPAEKRQTLSWALPFWFVLLAFPSAAALTAHAARLGWVEIFFSAFGVFFLFNVVDWLILDWLIFCTITPKFAVLPGTEGMAGYKNYAMHFRGFLIGTVLSVVIGVVMTAIVVLV